MRFIRGHNSVGMNRSKPYKSARYSEEDRGFKTVCWVWQMKVHPSSGYGMIRVAGRDWLAHRWHYEQAKGPIADGMQLDHLCRVRTCVNPDHLEPVTAMENARRGQAAKLSLKQARMIETLARSGHSAIEIGKTFGVTRETVRLIRERGADVARRDR